MNLLFETSSEPPELQYSNDSNRDLEQHSKGIAAVNGNLIYQAYELTLRNKRQSSHKSSAYPDIRSR